VIGCSGGNVTLGGAPVAGPVPCVGVDVLNVNGGGGNDVLDTTQFVWPEANLDGGDGDDSLSGVEGSNPSSSLLNATGGPGNDVLRFITGDSIAGGDGDDTFAYVNTLHSSGMLVQGQGGNDTYQLDLTGLGALPLDVAPLSGGLSISFGPGAQVAPWSGIEVVDLKLTEGSEIVRLGAFPGTGRVEGRGGNDTMLGGDGKDAFFGGAGNDTLEGEDGADTLDGGEGDDVVRSRDEFADTVVCGSGSDVAVVDGADSTTGCETRQVGSATDAVKPKPKFSGAKLSGLKLKLKAKCPASELRCLGEATLTGLGTRNGRSQTVKLGDVLVVADGGRKDKITFALTRAQSAALRRLTKAKLKIAYDVMDAGGNVGKGTVKISLKT
jgi:Ca2+-binding RTX toxin-like protein